jgi:hypothetical protein
MYEVYGEILHGFPVFTSGSEFFFASLSYRDFDIGKGSVDG